MLKEFKEFISRGNVLDLAVGVIVGGAFGKIVTSLVNDILMPIIGMILGGLDFSSLSLRVGNAKIMYGMFIQNVIDFLIIAGCVFIFVKFVNKLMHKKPETKVEPRPDPRDKPKPVEKPEDIRVLEEIRDLLKERKNEK